MEDESPILSNWDEEQFASIWQIIDLLEVYIVVMYVQVSSDVNYTSVLRINHESAVGSKQKMLAEKSDYHYTLQTQDVNWTHIRRWEDVLELRFGK